MRKLLNSSIITILTLMLFSKIASAEYYSTLPKGVRNFVFKYIGMDSVNSSYGPSGNEFQYLIHQNLNAKILEDISSFSKVYFDELKRIAPEAYDSFSFGEYSGNGQVDINVKGYGFAYGLTKNITAYVSVPHFTASVNMNIIRTKGNNHQEVSSILNQHGVNDDTASLWSQLTNELPDASGGLFQSVIVNLLGYQPIGAWNATGFGDTDLAAIFRLTDIRDMGMAITSGITIPTGRIDDPDILQDFGFGDGQFDVFSEIGAGLSLFNRVIDLDSSLRYTVQLPSNKLLRVPDSEDFTISADKQSFYEKLGNKLDFSIRTTLHPTDWISAYGEFLYNHIDQASYDSSNKEANRILAIGTEIETVFLKVGAELSTVNLYNSGTMTVPLAFELSAQTMMRGQNTPKYTRYDIGVKLYF
ncbi:MAG: hypothetical protein HN576_05235 [Bacteriovoracaceae bacterium]|jgi:hypothetical protein|nr:hypothetical protein [Bacteriovoracaceae bacterium]